MKKICLLLLSMIFVSDLYQQTPDEKLIATISTVSGTIDAYSMKYDVKTGGWMYSSYDTTARKYTLITPKGSSKQFSYIMQYNAIFDTDGNSYTTANDNITDTTYKYYILKNNEVLAEYDFINEAWVEKNGKIYFSAKEANKDYVTTYDIKTGIFDRGKAYDLIRLVYVPQPYYSEGEPIGYVGFTKDSKPYYVAEENNEVFFVVGGQEQKHYSDIGWYEVNFDANDNLCYIAKDRGKFYMDRGNAFVVQGDKEYTRYDWIYGPLLYDKNKKNIVYVGQDSLREYATRSTLMRGPEAMKTYEGSIYEYKYSPDGTLVYIVSEEKKNKNGESVSANTLVYGGKQYKNYNSISNVQFVDGSKIAFTASDKSNKYFVVIDGDIMTSKHDYITDYRYLEDGRFAYMATDYGNYDKKISDKCYVYIDGEKSGPYDMLSTVNWVTYAYITSDNKGNYAYVTGKNTDKENYYYVYKVHTNNWESKPFDNITEVRIINGKTVFFGGTQTSKDSYLYNYQLNINNKPVGETYSAYSDVKVDGNTMTFIGSKGSNVYRVEVKL